MFDELKQKGNKTAVTRSICGLIGSAGFIVIFFFNVFGLEPDAIERWKWIVVAMCTLAAIGSIMSWIRATNTSLMSGIDKFCKKTDNPTATMARLEKTWNEGLDFKSGRIDKEYIICLLGMRSKVIPLENAVWVYKHVSRNNGAVFVNVMVSFSNSETKSCLLNEGAVDAILSYVMKNCPDIAVGYEKELEKLHHSKDMIGLKERAHDQRAEQEST